MIEFSVLNLLLEELNAELASGHIEKVRQPSKDMLLLTVRKKRENKTLLISTSGGKARMHLTAQSFENPSEPPMFCMLLRKHLCGAEIEAFSQLNEDRIIEITVSARDELGRGGLEYLVLEMTGRCPNLLLLDSDRHVLASRFSRDIRTNPGSVYCPPEKPEAVAAGDSPEIDGSVSAYLDSFYSLKEREEQFRSKSKELRTALNSAVKRTAKKLAARKNELLQTQNREELRKKAELITANLYRLKKGDRVLICQDYYEAGSPEREIELDPLKSPQEYAAKLFKEYNRKKTAEAHLVALIDEAEQQLDFLLSEQDLLARASSDRDVAEIKAELCAQGFIKQKKSSKTKKEKPLPPYAFTLPSGKTALVGRNNTQNEELTFKTARRSDWWFHAKDYHGSHVILICSDEEPTEEDISFCASLASSNSEAAGPCPVDYCRVKNVKKQKGALPGRVFYTDYSTYRP